MTDANENKIIHCPQLSKALKKHAAEMEIHIINLIISINQKQNEYEQIIKPTAEQMVNTITEIEQHLGMQSEEKKKEEISIISLDYQQNIKDRNIYEEWKDKLFSDNFSIPLLSIDDLVIYLFVGRTFYGNVKKALTVGTDRPVGLEDNLPEIFMMDRRIMDITQKASTYISSVKVDTLSKIGKINKMLGDIKKRNDSKDKVCQVLKNIGINRMDIKNNTGKISQSSIATKIFEHWEWKKKPTPKTIGRRLHSLGLTVDFVENNNDDPDILYEKFKIM